MERSEQYREPNLLGDIMVSAGAGLAAVVAATTLCLGLHFLPLPETHPGARSETLGALVNFVYGPNSEYAPSDRR